MSMNITVNMKMEIIKILNLLLTVKLLIITVTLLLHIPSAKGTLFQPIAYTFPDGLQSVNGSNSTGGCQDICVMMPNSGTTNGCDCPGTSPVSGVLIDGDIPSIDTTQRGTWASGLFVVNRNGQDSIVIGFQFSSFFCLREVEVSYLDCAIWQAGVSTINVYYSNTYPSFFPAVSPIIGVFMIRDASQNCTSLRTLSIPVQSTVSKNSYFIEFSFVVRPSVNPLNWLHLGEIRFSDIAVTTPTTSIISTTSGETTDSSARPSSTTMEVQLHTTSSSSASYNRTSGPTFTFTDHSITQPTTPTTDSASSMDVSTSASSTSVAVPVTTIVGALVGVILLLILLILLGVAFMSCFYFYNKRHLKRLEVRQLQYIVTENPVHELESFAKLSEENRMSVAINSHYQPANHLAHGPPVPPRDNISPESDLYSEIRDVSEKGRSRSTPTHVNSGLYEDIPESNYTLIPETSSKDSPVDQLQDINLDTDLKQKALSEKKPNYTLIQKPQPPPVPEKSGELSDYLGLKLEAEQEENNQQKEQGTVQLCKGQTENEEFYSELQEVDKPAHIRKRSVENKHYALAGCTQLQVPTIEVIPAGIYSELGAKEQGVDDVDFYTDMHGNRTPSPSRSRRSSCESNLVPLSKPLCDKMEDNPMYDMSGSLLNAFISYREDIYTDPDDRFKDGSQQAIYEAVYSDSFVKPSMFKKEMKQQKDNLEMESEPSTAEENSCEEGEEEEVIAYASIYTLQEASPLPKKEPLTVTNANIHGVKVLGTGFFGKVVLADTVGLSLKDLNLSDDDDDKSVSVRVAVKKLKPNASKTTQEAFEKEYKFMARLNHPNVIRMLGVCTSDPSQFIMMEYMERGDLNEYLTGFEKIINDGAPEENEILIGTLVYMCSQIASAMNYLVSRNFIHRDLAARNCLVGDNNLIKLADFGMSRSLYESHYYIIRGQAVLPVRWMANECFYGKFSAKTDVWAFGVTMWEIFMLAKDRPYSEMEDLELVNDAIENEERTLLQQPEHCPDDVYQVMMSCWARDPKDRATFNSLYATLSQLSINSVDDSAI